MKSIYIQYEIYILYPIVCLVYLALVVYNRLRSRNTLLYIISWLMITYTVFKIVKTVISFSCVKCSHEQAIYTGVSRTISMMAYFSAHWIFAWKYLPTASLISDQQLQTAKTKMLRMILLLAVLFIIVVEEAYEGTIWTRDFYILSHGRLDPDLEKERILFSIDSLYLLLDALTILYCIVRI